MSVSFGMLAINFDIDQDATVSCLQIKVYLVSIH